MNSDARVLKEEEKLECKICFDEYTEATVYFMKNCDHIFHRECLKHYLVTEIGQNRCPILCCIKECKTQIASEDMMRNLSHEEMDKYLK